MQDRSLTENLLSDVLIHLNIPLASCRDFPANVVEALHLLGEFSQHDRVLILEIRPDMTYSIEYEWCCKKVDAVPERLKCRSVFYSEPLEQQLCSRNYILFRGTEEFLEQDFKEVLQEQQCRQMLLLPLFESGSQFAFIGFMQCTSEQEWVEGKIRMLEDIAVIIARQLDNYRITCRLLHRLRKEKEIRDHIEIFHTKLRRLQADLIPGWEQLKNKLSVHQDFKEDVTLSEIDRHVETLDKICREIPVKG